MIEPDGVLLDDIATALADQGDYARGWRFNRRTGAVEFPVPDDFDEDAEEIEDDDDLIAIEPLPSRVWYRDMADFAALQGPRAADALGRALQGRGAFRRFRDVLHDRYEDLVPEWRAFEKERRLRRATEWLRDNGMNAREFPPRGAGERALLDGWLDYYRASLEAKCAGVGPAGLVRRSCPPSAMSLIGLVRHMTEMERVYVQRRDDPALPFRYVTGASPHADFDDAAEGDAEDDLRIFAAACARSREVLAGAALDDDLRWTYLYLMKEYGRHLGHADLLREAVDGATGE